MNLAIFDIDGTLTESNEIDDACFVQAFQEALGIQLKSTNWLDYRYQTDSGLALEICKRHLNRGPCETEIRQLQSRFVELLSAAVKMGQPIREIRGAAAVLRWLGTHTEWETAIATGGWGSSARFKLGAAELPSVGIPWANADDALDRREIIRIAISRAEDLAQVTFEKIVYIGDGAWDVRAANDLGLGFVGIATGGEAMRQFENRASYLIPDFSDLVRFGECLERA